MFDGEIVKKKFPLKKNLVQDRVQGRVQDKVQDKVGLWKSETNLSWTMKFILDFCHRLSIGPIQDTILGLRQICLRFPVLFFYLSRTFQ